MGNLFFDEPHVSAVPSSSQRFKVGDIVQCNPSRSYVVLSWSASTMYTVQCRETDTIYPNTWLTAVAWRVTGHG